jgi:hypothetical protein
MTEEGRMHVKGILVEGRDGQEYLLGFGRQPTGELSGPPTLSRRVPDGTFRVYEDLQEASRVVVAQLGPRQPGVIGPGWGKELFLWGAFAEAFKSLPEPPSWPPWRKLE